MGTIASDSFEGTEGDDLPTYNSNWTKHTSYTDTAEITNNRARASKTSGSALTLCYHSASPASADYDVAADVYLGSNAGTGGVAGRVNTGANTLYTTRYNYATGWQLQLYKIVSGSATQLGGNVATGYASGETRNIKLSMSGTSISSYMDGSSSPDIGPVTDSGISATGKGAIRMSTTGTPGDTTYAQIAYWEATEADAGGQPYRKRLGGVPFAAHNAGVW